MELMENIRKVTLQDIEDYKQDKLTKKKKTTDKSTWKKFERKVAYAFKTTRTPLSGMVKTITNSDTLHPKIYVECKLRGGANNFNFYEDFRDNRTGEGVEYYKIIDSKTGFSIALFKSEDFFSLVEQRELDLKSITCAKETTTYRSVLTLFYQTIERAKIEDKTPVVALQKKNKTGYLIGINMNDLEKFHTILKRSK